MKRLGILMMCIATLALASCNALQSAAGSDLVAQTAGQTCGAALLNLYKTYKSTGTVSLADPTTLSSALTLATAYTQIKQNKSNQSYRKAFTNGLILSSAGLVTNNNSNAFIDALLGASALSNLNSTSTQNETQQAGQALHAVMKTLN